MSRRSQYFPGRWYADTIQQQEWPGCACFTKFRSKLQAYFDPIISDAKSNGKVDSSIFRKAQMDFAYQLTHPEASCIYYEFVLDTLDEFISKDTRVMTGTLKEYVNKRLESYGFSLEDHNKYKYYRAITHRCRSLKIPVKDRVFTLNSVSQVFHKPFVFQDFKFVQRLLRYFGPENFGADDIADYIQFVGSHLWNFFCAVVPMPGNRLGYFSGPKFEKYCEGLSPKRCKLLLMSIHFFRNKCFFSSVYGLNCVNSLNLFLEHMPDAWISSKEVYDFLQNTLTNVDYDIEKTIEDFCKLYEQEFPGSVRAPEPRPLKHLARCEVRKRLSMSGNLPRGVQDVGLPRALQEYIVFANKI